ncbi:hypothetical protein OHA72_35040 [Dactylosporangium sp. NBC_01737]|uniref:hypothetical protein n=1 Tax=Dactylosporangium sp. NBC_01737 TaxID=2975959 RepID=UPI002E0E8A78|nr:hypothetical protein OHA72_35040 [Dactylosporangium sp. NBC_01737]
MQDAGDAGVGAALGHLGEDGAFAVVEPVEAVGVALIGSFVPVGAAVGTGAWAVAAAGFTGCAVSLLRAPPGQAWSSR